MTGAASSTHLFHPFLADPQTFVVGCVKRGTCSISCGYLHAKPRDYTRLCNGQSDHEHKRKRCSYMINNRRIFVLRVFAPSRLCVLILSLTQSRRDAKSIVNPCLDVFRVVAHPTDHYRLHEINTEILWRWLLRRLCNLVVPIISY